MSRLSELIQEYCPFGVEYRKIGEIGKIAMCKRILKSQTSSEGDIPFYKIGTFGGIANAFISEELFEEYSKKYSYPQKGNILISAAGTVGRTVIFDGHPSYFQDSNIVWLEHDNSKVLDKYLMYVYETKPWKTSEGGTISRLYNDNILEAEIPVPPLEVQREIVRVLENFSLLRQELSAELSARRKQYEYYREKMLSNVSCNPQMVRIGDLGKWTGGKTPSMAEPRFWRDGTIPWISSKDMKSPVLNDTEDHITEAAINEAGMNLLPAGTVAIVTRSGILKHTFPVAYIPFETTINQDIKALIHNDDVNPKYAAFALQGFGEDIRRRTKKLGGTVDSLDFDRIKDYEIPLPSMEIQNKIVDVLDNFEAICNDLNIGLPAEIEARTKQYEFYRDQLLTFAESGKTILTTGRPDDRTTGRPDDRTTGRPDDRTTGRPDDRTTGTAQSD